MTTQTTTLADFLLARIAEDEQTARLWGKASRLNAAAERGSHLDPSRMLAECEAKRRIVADCIRAMSGRDIQGAQEDGDDGPATCDTHLRLLAQPYADHPEFREEWRVV